MKIFGSTILLTGASGGLGSAIARDLSSRGAHLILTARRESVLAVLAEETGSEIVVADLADRDDVERLIERARSVDVLIANAGIGGESTLDTASTESIDQSIDVNLRAPIVMSTAFAQHKIAEDLPGAIVLVGSLSGIAATPNTRMYNATKFGLRGFALAMHQDLSDTNVTMSLVAPSFIESAGMFAEGDMKLPSGVRMKSPADVAAGVVKAIESAPAEVFVSPIELRLGAAFSSIAPGLSARVMKVVGAADITANR